MSRFGDALRALWVGPEERATSLSYMLGPQSRVAQSAGPMAVINQDTAFRNSVWWACLHLTANVTSTFQLQVFRPAGDGLTTRVQSPGLMFDQPFPGLDITDFSYGMAMDRARYGNAIGIIRARNANGVVMQVEPVAMADASAVMNGRKIRQWRVGQDYYQPSDIWHERQWTLNGYDLGLSSLANAALSMQIYASAQQFALDWFALGAKPRGHMKNIAKSKLDNAQRDMAKEEFKAATQGGDMFVTGNEWEWTPYSTDAMSTAFLAQENASDRDICRYLGVPASMVDVEVSTGNITYANITQANLQWLITQIGPVTVRNERLWTRLATPKPWTVTADTTTLLRMDPLTRDQMFREQVTAMTRAPSEVRALDNLPAYTAAQLHEIEVIARLRKPPPAGTPLDPAEPPPVPETPGASVPDTSDDDDEEVPA